MLLRLIGLGWFCLVCGSASLLAGAEQRDLLVAGVAKIDVTPTYPIRLTGYAVRRSESEGIAQHLYAKAIALGADGAQPAILITVDNCGVPAIVREEVATRLARRVAPDHLAICSTHTHSGPWVNGFAPNIFPVPISAAEQQHVDKYTQELTDALEAVALYALADRRPVRLSWGKGKATFAANRRTKGGPTDPDLPALFITGAEGGLRAVLVSYACHCTTLGGEFNQLCGDWAGYAQEAIERNHSGAIALVALGCAGDANPSPRPGLDFARQHGQSIATAIEGILTNSPVPLSSLPTCRMKRFELPLDALPTRAEWETRARETNAIGVHARLNLARLDRGEALPTRIPYSVQTWTFGDQLAMVFLAGEVVVDYSLRLKQECDSSRIWVNAYANDVPCYIASERILKEGGYEGGGAMIYYDKSARLAPGVENLIVSSVHELLPKQFLSR